MKKIILMILFYVPLASPNESLAFDLTCQILEQSIFTLNQGKSEKYDSYKDDLKKGDTFYINFKFDKTEKDTPPRLNVESEWLEINEVFSLEKNDTNTDYDLPFVKLFTVFRYAGTETVLTDSWNGIINYDRINFSDSANFLYKISMNRYYLNDWQLIFFDMFDGGGFFGKSGYQIVTANCMRMPKEYNELLRLFNINE